MPPLLLHRGRTVLPTQYLHFPPVQEATRCPLSLSLSPQEKQRPQETVTSHVPWLGVSKALSAHPAGCWPGSRRPGAGTRASQLTRTRGEFLQTIHTVRADCNRRAKSAGCTANLLQSSFCTLKITTLDVPEGSEGAYNSPGLALLGFLVIGLWLLNLTVAVCLRQ